MESVRCAFVHTVTSRSKLQCTLPTEEGTKNWCSRHNQVRQKVYFGYKSCHRTLDALPEFSISHLDLENCSSYETVKQWSVKLREKLKLLNRCIWGRTYFTERFFGNDEDLGHEIFRMNLEQQSTETEKLLECVEKRAYVLLLASQNAVWVMEDRYSEPAEECRVFNDDPISKRKKPVPFEEIEDEEDPVDVAIREKRQEIWEKIWTRLARYCAPIQSRFYKERLAVIWACICRAVYTDPKLMMVAQNYTRAYDMLADTNLDLLTVEKLWKAIKELRVDDIRAAIEDVFYPVRQTGDYIVVFNTCVHKDLITHSYIDSFPFHGWGHMTAIFPCYSCVRKVCTTVDEIVVLTRYVLLTGCTLAQSVTRYDYEYLKFRGLAFCGFLPNVIKEVNPRFTIKKCNSEKDSYWSETKSNNVLCVGLSLNDKKAREFVNACFRDPRLMVRCRQGPSARVLTSRLLCSLETRRASTRASLKSAPWEPHTPSYLTESILEDALPIVSAEKRLADCFQVAIVDGGEGDMNDFINYLMDIWSKIYDVDEYGPLLACIGGEYIGSIDLHYDGMIPNTELNVLESYKALWKRDPREKQVDDEVANVVSYFPL